MRNKTKLERRLQRLNHGSQQAVQNGRILTELDRYLHVNRPVEHTVKEKMRQIQREGGGLLLLVGSAGDGKSHIISNLRDTEEFSDFAFHNDATESCGPGIKAVETLKYALSEFRDANIDTTTDKLLVAINLGKLLDLVDDAEIKTSFTRLAQVGNGLALERIHSENAANGRIHIVSLAHQQIFELEAGNQTEYPFSSKFMTAILERLTDPSDSNPFYQDFKQDIQHADNIDPVLLNYRMLCSGKLRDTLVRLIIEASFRFNLVLTPRDYLDFIYSIIVPKNLDHYREAKDFFSSSLPNLVFASNDSKIQRVLNWLDPMKICSLSHDRHLSELYATFRFTPAILPGIDTELATDLGIILDRFYQNHQDEKPEICALQFRLSHLLGYHSDSCAYKSFLRDLTGYWRMDQDSLERIDEMVKKAIPRHYGSYISHEDMIPLNIQGARYKLFASLDFPETGFTPAFDPAFPHVFEPSINMEWTFDKNGTPCRLPLKLNYRLYEHLYELLEGKLSTSFENDRHLSFSRFVRDLARLSDSEKEIKVIASDSKIQSLFPRYNRLQLR